MLRKLENKPNSNQKKKKKKIVKRATTKQHSIEKVIFAKLTIDPFRSHLKGSSHSLAKPVAIYNTFDILDLAVI